MRLEHAAIIVAAAAGAALIADRLTPDDAAEAEATAQPSAAMNLGAGATSLPRDARGHFWAEAQVNGARVRFLVDTGATLVALTPSDARRAGVDMRALIFNRPVGTAGGQIFAASVTLDDVAVASLRERDVDALVVADGLEHSLLGMSYLGRLSRIEATPNALILRR